MSDDLDAAWHQSELDERHRWEQHRRVNREFREWMKDEFPDWFLHINKQEYVND